MGDRTRLHSPLKRARMGVEQWLEALPKDVQFDATSALDRLCEAAEREIEQAYFDGHNQRRWSEQIGAFRERSTQKAGHGEGV